MTVVENGEEDVEKIKVAVRVRPLNKREYDLSTKCVVSVANDQLALSHPNEGKQPKPFTFDHCFNSIDVEDPSFCSQEQVFDAVGCGVVANAFAGYNACVFAYGQTGSGKSYTMMGSSDNPGLIPRLCTTIFERIETETNASTSFKVEVSYMEIYNEKVRDLLDPKNSTKRPLKVREHSVLGPMVEGLAVLAVSGYAQISRLLDDGNKCRTVAATNMNAESSRSHAVFTVRLTQTVSDISDSMFTGEKLSKISLVDLAGSERAQKTGAIGKRLEEGANINKSLTTLGMVISALADRTPHANKREKFIPYRDSVLTWLLKDNLGGNSKTVMIATVSPSSDNYEETLSTLRYADRAKKIVNRAKINEDPNAKVIRELREEVETLRLQINQNQDIQNEAEELRERLAESERLVALMNKSWEERLRDTDVLNTEHQRDLSRIGVSVAAGGIKVEKDRFYLVNLNADPSLNELLVYYINQQAIVGSAEQTDDFDAHPPVDFLLQGLGVHPRHALLEIVQELATTNTGGDTAVRRPRLYVSALKPGARVCVNGRLVDYGERALLCNGYRLLIGNNHFFRVNCPRDDSYTNLSSALSPSDANCAASNNDIINGGVGATAAVGYDNAWLEANSGDYAQNVVMDQYIEEIAAKHEEDKQAALEKQYEEFERYIHGLTQTLATPSTPMTPSASFQLTAGTPGRQLPPVSFAQYPRNAEKSKFFKWAQKRDELFKQSLSRLKTEIVRAHALAREANLITEELWTQNHSRNNKEESEMSSRRGLVRYEVTLQIPAANLRPSKIKAGNSVCEPVIVVKWHGMSGWQLWSVERLENKLVDLRELYNEHQQQQQQREQQQLAKSSTSTATTTVGDDSGRGSVSQHSSTYTDERADSCSPNIFSTLSNFECQEKHSLIGVANVFLEVLFHPLRLDYHVPIISQQGEVCGKLHVEVYRIPTTSREKNQLAEENGGAIEEECEDGEGFLGRTITCRVRIKDASNLPSNLSHFVFCQYSLFNASEMQVVAPQQNIKQQGANSNLANVGATNTFRFEHEKDFTVVVTDEFLEYVQEDALSIEVWGHRSGGIANEDEDYRQCAAENAIVGKRKSSDGSGVAKNQDAEFSISANIASGLTKLLSFGGAKLPLTASEVPTVVAPRHSASSSAEHSDNENRGTKTFVPKVANLSELVARKQKSLQERWAEVTKRVEMWVEILEINDDGNYAPVDVAPIAAQSSDIATQQQQHRVQQYAHQQPVVAKNSAAANMIRTGGVYQLKQGQQRRIRVRLRGVAEDGATSSSLPLDFADIMCVSVGSVVLVRNGQIASFADDLSEIASNIDEPGFCCLANNSNSNMNRPLDSYQEDDLERIRDQWLRALANRHDYLEAQIKELSARDTSTKSETDWEREQSLISQWVELTEERNAVSLPPPNSHIPGAPADWHPPQGVEYYVPVTFLDLDAEELAANEALDDEADEEYRLLPSYERTAGLNTTLPFEEFEHMLPLPMLAKDLMEMCATCSWDSSVHQCAALNRAPANAVTELVCACVNVTCRLAYPFSVNLVLRKRICVSLYKRPSFAERIMRKIVGTETISGTGVYYDIVAHVPKSSLDVEDRSALAIMAVRHTVSYGEGEFGLSESLSQTSKLPSASLQNLDDGTCGASNKHHLDLSASTSASGLSPNDDDDDDDDVEDGDEDGEEYVEYRDGVRTIRRRRRRRRKQNDNMPPNGQSFGFYIETYTKAIQAVEWMLKLDRLRQESAMYSMISKREKNSKAAQTNRRSIYNSNSFRMKRAISLPSTMNKMALPPIAPTSARISARGLPPSGRHVNNNFDASALPPPPPSSCGFDELPPTGVNVGGGSSESTSAGNAASGIGNSNAFAMEMSTSAASSGYASMDSAPVVSPRPTFLNLQGGSQLSFSKLNSMMSPSAECGESARLYGIDEEMPDNTASSSTSSSSSASSAALVSSNNATTYAQANHRWVSKIRSFITVPETFSGFSAPSTIENAASIIDTTPAMSGYYRRRAEIKNKNNLPEIMQNSGVDEPPNASPPNAELIRDNGGDCSRTNHLFLDEELATAASGLSDEISRTNFSALNPLLRMKNAEDDRLEYDSVAAQCENPLMIMNNDMKGKQHQQQQNQQRQQQQCYGGQVPPPSQRHQRLCQQRRNHEKQLQQQEEQPHLQSKSDLRPQQQQYYCSGNGMGKKQPQYFVNTRHAAAASVVASAVKRSTTEHQNLPHTAAANRRRDSNSSNSDGGATKRELIKN